jgi:hypothetical protein
MRSGRRRLRGFVSAGMRLGGKTMALRHRIDSEFVVTAIALFGAFLSLAGIGLAIEGVLFAIPARVATGLAMIVCGTLLYILMLCPHGKSRARH